MLTLSFWVSLCPSLCTRSAGTQNATIKAQNAVWDALCARELKRTGSFYAGERGLDNSGGYAGRRPSKASLSNPRIPSRVTGRGL